MGETRFLLFFKLLAIAAILLDSACGGGGGGASNNDAGSDNSQTRSFSAMEISDDSGRATGTFDISTDVSKFSVTVDSSAPIILINSIVSDTGVIYQSTDEFISLSQAIQPLPAVSSVPSRDFDPPVSPGSVSIAVDALLGATFTPAIGAQVDFTINTSTDSDLESGVIPVNLFLVGEFAQTAQVKAAIAGAREEMARIYKEGAKITVAFNQMNVDGPPVIPNPFEGSPFYFSLSSNAASPAVNIFFSADVAAFESASALGITGSIPAPPIPTGRSAIAIGLIASSGPDGKFSANDIRLLGETLAHESGHFLGLFHPIEIDSLTLSVNDVDPLPDTLECSTVSDCLANAALIRNLMFPFPVVGKDDASIPQNILTKQQGGVMNRYVAVS